MANSDIQIYLFLKLLHPNLDTSSRSTLLYILVQVFVEVGMPRGCTCKTGDCSLEVHILQTFKREMYMYSCYGSTKEGGI